MQALGGLVVPHQYNLVDHFLDRHLKEGRGDKVAIISGPRRLTYRDVAREVNLVGNSLLRLGVQEEQRVLLVLPDSPEFVSTYFGVMKIGAVAVPTSTAMRSTDYAHFLDDSRAKLAIVHSSYIPEFRRALAGQRYCKNVIICGDPVQGYSHWDEFLKDASPELEAVQTCKDDSAFWLWTSGSTGKPKAAVHLHRDWVYCCEYYARGILDIQSQDITFSSSKLFHAYGLGNGLMFPFHVGATTLLYPEKAKAKGILETAESGRPTLFFSVPTLYAAMLQEAEQRDYDLRSVRLAASAAEPLPAEVFRRWRNRFGVEILDGIGSTEVLHIYLSARAGKVRPGSTGQAVSGYELRLVDDAEQEVPVGAIGDLMVAGPSTAQRYWNRQDLTQSRIRGRWFVTGDKYTVDHDGYYWYAGRADDMFRVSGQWVSPIEVECALIEHPCVFEVAVVPFEEDLGIHTPKAFVVLAPGYVAGLELAKELKEFVKQRILPHKYPRHIEFLPELPKTAAGKILRYKLRQISRRTSRSFADGHDIDKNSVEST
ncbi:MAG: benzoate-CoA ligase family protein [Acidobacteria bacterium]|nr:benzoate-CoA ligase family protein [Acidobacteriota bacterium]